MHLMKHQKVYLISTIFLFLCTMACSYSQVIIPVTPLQATSTPTVLVDTSEDTSLSPTSAPTNVPDSPAYETIPVLSTKKIDEYSEDPKYTIEVEYPYLEGTANDDAFNQSVNDLVLIQIDDFKQLAGESEEWRVNEMPEIGSDLYIDYSVTNTKNGVINILFEFSYYYAGAAHPGSHSLVLNFDLNHGGRLELSDLFIHDSNYLEVISDYCIDQLKSTGYLDFEEGALPQPENYRNWNIQPEGILISFDPYQVAPYAVGPQKVLIPFSELRNVIRSDGPLALFL